MCFNDYPRACALGYHVRSPQFQHADFGGKYSDREYAKMVGHSSVAATTQIYAQIIDQKIARDMARFK